MNAPPGRPVPPPDLPVGAVCGLAGRPLTARDRWEVERFARFLADRRALLERGGTRAELAALWAAYEADNPPQGDMA